MQYQERIRRRSVQLPYNRVYYRSLKSAAMRCCYSELGPFFALCSSLLLAFTSIRASSYSSPTKTRPDAEVRGSFRLINPEAYMQLIRFQTSVAAILFGVIFVPTLHMGLLPRPIILYSHSTLFSFSLHSNEWYFNTCRS